jgi:hypothetical protein
MTDNKVLRKAFVPEGNENNGKYGEKLQSEAFVN